MSKAEIQYLVTFAAGIAAFWLSGQASVYAANPHLGRALSEALSLIVTLAVYGLGMAILTWLLYSRRRNFKAILAATISAIVLAAVGAQFLLRVVVHILSQYVHSGQQVGYLVFVAYLLYGFFYVVSAAIGRRMLH